MTRNGIHWAMCFATRLHIPRAYGAVPLASLLDRRRQFAWGLFQDLGDVLTRNRGVLEDAGWQQALVPAQATFPMNLSWSLSEGSPKCAPPPPSS